MPRRIARYVGGVVDRRTPAEVAATDELDAMIAEAVQWDKAELAAIRAEATRDDLTPADEDALAERYRVYRRRRRSQREAGEQAERRIAKWVMRHGEPRTREAREALGAYLAKPAVKAAERAQAVLTAAAEQERAAQAEAATEAIADAKRHQRAQRGPDAPSRGRSADPTSEPQATPRTRQRRRPAGVVSMFDPMTGEIRRPITDND
jgi:hypothetical protein